MDAVGKKADGYPVVLTGKTASEIERCAVYWNCVEYTVQVEGGKETIRKVGTEWVVIS